MDGARAGRPSSYITLPHLARPITVGDPDRDDLLLTVFAENLS